MLRKSNSILMGLTQSKVKNIPLRELLRRSEETHKIQVFTDESYKQYLTYNCIENVLIYIYIYSSFYIYTIIKILTIIFSACICTVASVYSNILDHLDTVLNNRRYKIRVTVTQSIVFYNRMN